MDKLFGTDGIRGIFGEYPLNDEIVFKIGKGTAQFLLCQKRKTFKVPKVIIGKDTRWSCEKLEEILSAGITSLDVNVILTGVIPTPGLAFLTRKLKADMGIMLSASHNSPEDNGIKFFSNSGYKLSPSQEEEIEEFVFNDSSKLNELASCNLNLISRLKDPHKIYMDLLKSKAEGLKLNGFKIVIDCANGAYSDIAPFVFKDLGADIHPINNQPSGRNINLNCGTTYPENMARLVTQYNADIGICFDGDGDRVILSDEKRNLLDGDYIMAIIGLHWIKKNRLPKNTLVATVMSNHRLQEIIEDAGGKLIRTDVGDRNVTEALIKNNLIFGGEQSGHIIFLNHSTTGDGLITCLEILKVMKEKDKSLSELSHCLKKFPQVLINVKVKEKRPFEYFPQIQEIFLRSQSRLNGNGRFLVRYSGTEPVVRIMVEGKDQNLIEEVADSIAGVIQDTLGVHN